VLAGCASEGLYHVERVIDGRTIEASRDGEVLRIRSYAIKVAERARDGERARAALAALIKDRKVSLTFPLDGPFRDMDGCLLANVYRGRIDVGDELVRNGHADRVPWAARKEKKPYKSVLENAQEFVFCLACGAAVAAVIYSFITGSGYYHNASVNTDQ